MRAWILFLLLPFLLSAKTNWPAELVPSFKLEQVLPTAPLIPLEPQFPLELTQENRDLFIDNPVLQEKAKASLQHDLYAHTFSLLALVIALACGGIGWAAYLSRDRWLKPADKPLAALSTQQQIAEGLQSLQNCSYDQEHIPITYNKFSTILLNALQARFGWKTQELTTVELTETMDNEPSLSKEQIEHTLALFKEIDQVKFAGKTPSPAEAMQMAQQIRELIQKFN